LYLLLLELGDVLLVSLKCVYGDVVEEAEAAVEVVPLLQLLLVRVELEELVLLF
jgi:hypothetical protein